MTTPDDQITGYGGMPKHDGTSPVSQPSGSTSSAGASHASGSGSEDAKAKAREVAEEVKKQGKDQLEGYRETAADELEKVAKSAKAAAAELDQSHSGLSRYVSDMAQSMVSLADDLRGKSVDELVGEVNRIARNNPGLFITGSIAIGFGLTRFARASSQRAATGNYGQRSSLAGSMRHDSHSYSEARDQHELNERISSGAPGGSIGSISNAGVSSATSTGMGASGSSSTGGTGGSSTMGGGLSGSSTTGGSSGMPHSTTGSGMGSGMGSGTTGGAGSSGTATSGTGAGTPGSGAGSTGSHPNSGPGVSPTTDRTGKGTDGGMFP
jgi:hypothetical protein